MVIVCASFAWEAEAAEPWEVHRRLAALTSAGYGGVTQPERGQDAPQDS